MRIFRKYVFVFCSLFRRGHDDNLRGQHPALSGGPGGEPGVQGAGARPQESAPRPLLGARQQGQILSTPPVYATHHTCHET